MTSYIPRVLFKNTSAIPVAVPKELINKDGMLFWNCWTPEYHGDPRGTIVAFENPEDAWKFKKEPMKVLKKFLDEIQNDSPDLGDWVRQVLSSISEARKLLALHETHVVKHPVLPGKWAVVLEY